MTVRARTSAGNPGFTQKRKMHTDGAEWITGVDSTVKLVETSEFIRGQNSLPAFPIRGSRTTDPANR